MSRFNGARSILASLCSSTRLTDSRAHSWISGLHLIRSVSHYSRRARFQDGPTVCDHITGNLRRRTPNALPPSPEEKFDVAACRKAIEAGEDPETLFRSRLHTRTLTRASAAACLMEVSQRVYSEGNLGQTALTWLWDQRSDLIYPDDNGLVYAMVDLLVREGRETEVWRWISSDPSRAKDAPKHIRFEWRDTALKGLLMSKSKLSTNRSLDDAIKAFLRSEYLLVPSGGSSNWMFQQLTRYKLLQAHEVSPLINAGRRWDHVWTNTSIELWEKAVAMLPDRIQRSPMHQATLAMYHVRTPDPEPYLILFEDAQANPDHPLRELRFIISKQAYRTYAYHASDELRRMRRYDDAARLDRAREEILPRSRDYGDRPDRESIFTQGKPAKKLPFPKFE